MSTLHLPTTSAPNTIATSARSQIAGVGLLALASGMAVATLLGPLGLGLIRFAVSPGAETQLLGGEIVTALLAIPIAAAAGVLTLRGSRRAPMLASGPGIYAAYMYTQYVLAPDFFRYEGNSERAFPLYLLLVAGGWMIAAHSWFTVVPFTIGHGLGRGIGWMQVGINTLFAFAWIASILPIVLGREPDAAYLADPTLFWTVRLMDLSFVIPLGLVTGIALLRHHPAAPRLVALWLGAQTLLVSAVSGMAWMMQIRNDPARNPVFLVATTAIALAFMACWIRVWRDARHQEETVMFS